MASGNGTRERIGRKRIEDPGVGIREQRPSARNRLPPDREAIHGPRHRGPPSRAEDCRGRCPAPRTSGESSAGPRRQRRPARRTEIAGKQALDPRPHAERPVACRRGTSRRPAPSANRTGPHREIASPGTSSRHSISCASAGTGRSRKRRAAPARPSAFSRPRESCGSPRSPATRRAMSDPGSKSARIKRSGLFSRTRRTPGRALRWRAAPVSTTTSPGGRPGARAGRPGRPALPASFREDAGPGAPPGSRPNPARVPAEPREAGQRRLVPVADAESQRDAGAERRPGVSTPQARKPVSGCSMRERSPRSGSRLSTVPRSQRAAIAQDQLFLLDSDRGTDRPRARRGKRVKSGGRSWRRIAR